jgi:predicted nucleotidyltransferase component of viral defense system
MSRPPGSRLSTLQEQILSILADADFSWTLAGGAALVGFYLPYRTTRDLDIWIQGHVALDAEPRIVRDLLLREGLQVEQIQSAPSFVRLQVRSPDEQTLIDLVAEPHEPLEPARVFMFHGKEIRVEAVQELLVSKLCALLGRVEPRDLADVRALLSTGALLERALQAAPRKDGGFSIPTLAWLLENFDLSRAEQLLGADVVVGLTAFRDDLIARLIDLSRPEAE